MSARMFGAETEYAVSGIAPNGGMANHGMIVQHLLEAARRGFRYLPDRQSSGVFLENGSRFYIDCGAHPELSTPECTTPWEVVRYLLAGDRILEQLATQTSEMLREGHRVLVLKGNVDYSGSHSTWGAHESYCHRSQVEAMPGALIPHLVSRIVYTGAGGFNPLSPGLEFTLSPRAHHLTRVISEDSTGHRGIFHSKNESLSSNGYHRLHVLCGDSLFSETALWLKFGTTALVVAMIEAGVCASGNVGLKSPLQAVKTFAGDPECRGVVKLSNGHLASALQIQDCYLAMAEAHLHDTFMPDWAGEVCRLWRSVLESLSTGPARVDTMLDWAIKWALYKGRARRHGFTWEALANWSFVMQQLRAALDRTCDPATPITVEQVRSERSPIRNEVQGLTKSLKARKLDWDDLGAFLALRHEFFEIDTRFGQIGEEGIFSALDRAGKLTHRLPGIDRIQEATTEPPATGRAYLRGEQIRQLAGLSERYQCDWQGIWDRATMRWLDLSDPFASVAEWQAIPRLSEAWLASRERLHDIEALLSLNDPRSTR